MASKFQEAEETVKISMTSSTTIIGYSASFEVCFWHSPRKQEGGREAEREKTRGGHRKIIPGESKNEAKTEDTVISYRSGAERRGRDEDAAERRGWVDPLRRGGRKILSCREREAPARRARWPAPGRNGAAA